MSATEEPAGRQALAEALRRLYADLRPRGKTQKAAVEEANRRRRAAAGRAEKEAWPRTEGGSDLTLSTVNGWFPKRKGSTKLSVPADFADLWSVVVVMLEWTLPDEQSADRHLRHWKKLHEEAQCRNGMDEEVRGYLEAARKAAEQHPHQGIPGETGPPSLTEVYVRQRSHPVARGGYPASPDVPAAGGGGTGLAVRSEPAEAVFRKADRLCVLIAGPGTGKSTLLRRWLRDAAGKWPAGTPNAGTSGPAVPVWVSARALVGEETQLPDVLAAATRRLSRYGRHPELARARFLQRPWTGAHWQVLVDDLDELPTADERRAVLEKLANAVAADPPLYRCVVATRPLTENELNVLDRVLGRQVPHYALQPFTTDDLHTYIEKHFSTRWPQQEATHRARHFAGTLRSASLDELARTPLMALMLCQLHLAEPERQLPDGRTAVYEAFTDLVYENNQGKRVADSHEESIKHLVESVQSPQARKDADAAARQVHERLPELIDYLAHRWLSGHEAPVTEALASHEAVRRPGKVRLERWEAFLEDLLLHTGLLVHRADGLGFLHRTFLEYHAARHATRDEAARAQLLHDLFPPQEPSVEGPPQPPRLPASHLGFLLDGLLGAEDSIATETARRLETLAERGELKTIPFLVVQAVNFKTNLPLEPLVRRLLRLVEQPSSYDPFDAPVSAAWWLSLLDGYLEAGADLLIRFAEDDFNRVCDRVKAVGYLGQLEGYREGAAAWLARWAQWSFLEVDERVLAAKALAQVEGHRESGVTLLARFIEDTTLDLNDRMQAAQGLAAIPEERGAGAAWLARFAEDATVDGSGRVWAAWELAKMDEYEEAGATLLTHFVEEASFNGEDRTWAAWGLAQLGGHREAGIAWLTRFGKDTTMRGKAAPRLEEVDKDAYASLLTSIVEDSTESDCTRALTAWTLAGLDGHEQTGATWLARFIGSTESPSSSEAVARILELFGPNRGSHDEHTRS